MKAKKGVSNDMVDWYSRIPKGLLKKYHNPNYEKHRIKLIFRAALVGGSGSGKTTLVLELIKRMAGTFNLIVLCCRNSDEPLYEYLKSKLKPDQLLVYEGGNIPHPDEFKGMSDQIMIVFDDLVNMADQRPIVEWFVRGRKVAGGCSLLYLTQSYFEMPKIIRLQCNYIFIKSLQSTKDLMYVLSDFNLGVDKKTLLEFYKEATKEKRDFLLVDIDAKPEHRFRHNLLKVFELPEQKL